jgi:hypothetical protein
LYGGKLDDGAKGLIIVHPKALGEPLEDPMSLVPVPRVIHLGLVLEDPFIDDTLISRG